MNDFARQIYDNLVAACGDLNCDECACSHLCDLLMDCAEMIGREFEREEHAE